MQMALGATRARISGQLFVESLVPGVAGAALAVAIGQVARRERLIAAIPDAVRIGMPYSRTPDSTPKVIAVIGGVTGTGGRLERRASPVHHEERRSGRRCSGNAAARRSTTPSRTRCWAGRPHHGPARCVGLPYRELPQPGLPRPRIQGSTGCDHGTRPALRSPLRRPERRTPVLRVAARSQCGAPWHSRRRAY